MISFYVITVLFLLILIFIYFYIIKRRFSYLSIKDGSIDLYRQQVIELKRDHSLGYINENEFKIINDELYRRILNDKPTGDFKNLKENKNFTFLCKSVVTIVLFSAVVIYGINGRPNMPDFSIYSRDTNAIPKIYWQLTLKDIEKKILQYPKNIDYQVIKANVLLTLGKTNESINVWETILKLPENNIDPSSLFLFAETIVNQNIKQGSEHIVSDRAIKIFTELASTSAITTRIGGLSRYYLSLAALEEGNIKKAQLIWKEIKSKVPDNLDWTKKVISDITNLQANYFSKQDLKVHGMLDKLEKKLLDSNSNQISDWKMLGKSSLIIKQFDRAEKAYRRAYDLNEHDMEVIIGLAESRLYQNKKNKDTIDLFKKILIMNENHPLALWVLSEYEISKGNKLKAIFHLEKLLSNLPTEIEEYSFIAKKIEELRN